MMHSKTRKVTIYCVIVQKLSRATLKGRKNRGKQKIKPNTGTTLAIVIFLIKTKYCSKTKKN